MLSLVRPQYLSIASSTITEPDRPHVGLFSSQFMSRYDLPSRASRYRPRTDAAFFFSLQTSSSTPLTAKMHQRSTRPKS